jgi:hypothetical protein
MASRQKLAAQTVLPMLPPVPAWARSGAAVTDSAAAFQTGAALAALDARVRADARAAPFAGAWRRRLALKAAAASARIARRGEDEASLRDSFFLRRGSDDPGPAGRLLVAWRGLDRSAPLARLSSASLRDPVAQGGRRPARGDRAHHVNHVKLRKPRRGLPIRIAPEPSYWMYRLCSPAARAADPYTVCFPFYGVRPYLGRDPDINIRFQLRRDYHHFAG